MKGSGLSPQDSSRLRVEVPHMALLVEYKCEQTIPNIYSIKHKNIKHIRMLTIKACKIYKHKWERERKVIANTEIYFEVQAICSTSLPSPLWRIFTIMIPQNHLVSQHLQWAPSRTLRPASPSLIPARTIYANPQARRGRNLYNSSKYKGGTLGDHFRWSPTNTLTNKDPLYSNG